MQSNDRFEGDASLPALEAFFLKNEPKRQPLLPILVFSSALLLALCSYLLYRPEGYGEIYRSASLIGEFLTENETASVFLGLDEEKEEKERRKRIEEKAEAYIQRLEE